MVNKEHNLQFLTFSSQVFADWDFVQEHNVCSINSVNWGRIMVQAAHHIFIHFYMVGRGQSRTSEIVIPTGACGNIAAGCVAYKMGVPLRLVAAVNENDIVSRFIRNGDFSVSPEVRSETVKKREKAFYPEMLVNDTSFQLSDNELFSWNERKTMVYWKCSFFVNRLCPLGLLPWIYRSPTTLSGCFWP